MKKISPLKSWLLLALFTLSIPVLRAQVEINPNPIGLGEWPIGGWQESKIIELTNSSPDTLNIISSELIDANNVFSFDNISLPSPLLPFMDTARVTIGFIGDNITEGVYHASYQLTCEGHPSPSTAQVMVSAYEPIIGDIVENPILVSPPYTAPNQSTAHPFRDNYRLTASSSSINDVVYKIELLQDEILQIDVSGTSIPAILALYEESFQGENGPMMDNALAITEGNYLDIAVTAGNYYLIVSPSIPGNTLHYDLSVYTNQWPLPDLAFNPSPADGATDVPNLNMVLNYEFSDLVQEYQVFLGPSYPPTLEWIPWTPVGADNSVYIPQLDGNTTYYWQVNVMNNTGFQQGDIWSFETGLSSPTDITAIIIISDPMNYIFDVEVTWSMTSNSKDLLGFNVYRSGVMINTSLVNTMDFTDVDVPYNMDPCYVYQVEAVFDQGVSPPIADSNPVCINGLGNIYGQVTDLLTGDSIAPAELFLVEVNSGMPWVYVTDINGYYSGDIPAGNYNYYASADGYTTAIRENVLIEYDQTTTEDFQLGPYPYPVDTLWASITNDTNVLLEWTMNNSNPNNPVLGYNIFRGICESDEPYEFIGMIIGNSYLDEDWNILDMGFYNYLIEAVYPSGGSEPMHSNCLDNNATVTVNVEVYTDIDYGPEGTEIVFINTSEPNLELQYEILLDETGLASIPSFIKGNYDILIQKDYFEPMEFQGVYIDSDTTFVWGLTAFPEGVIDLYVTPTGLATWGLGYPEPMEIIFEDFNDGIPTNWEVMIGGNSSDSWVSAEGPGLDGSPYLRCDSYAAGDGIQMDEYLISPIIDYNIASEIILEWDQNYQNSSAEDYFSVEVFNGIDWIVIYFQNTDDNPWPEIQHQIIDISSYANPDLKVRFHYFAPNWNWYVGIDNVHIHDNSGKSTSDFQFYKIFHDGIFVNDGDTGYYNYEDTELFPELIPGETYTASVAALHSTGLSSFTYYTWTYMPSGGFIGPTILLADLMEGSNDILIQWTNLAPIELIEVNQNYGPPQTAFYQEFEHGYGVIYDLNTYPDAMINAVDFRHSSWGDTGVWDYNIHVIDWDSKTTLAQVGPFQTTGDDKWEDQVFLGEIAANGALEVAILVEPLGNTPNNAYPRLDTDGASDAQGSIYGSLEDLEIMDSSPLGNFLMDLWIHSANGGKQLANNKELPNYYSIGTHVYRNDSLIAFVPDPDTFYMDQNVNLESLSYCVATVYTADGGAHTWTSPNDEICVEDIMFPPTCDPPMNLSVYETPMPGNTVYCDFEWDVPGFFQPVWLQYDDGVNVDGIGGPAEFSYAVKWDPDQLQGFDGAVLSKVNFFPREEGTAFTLKVWKGENASTLLYEQSLNDLNYDAWNEIELTNSVPIDPSETLWLGFYVVTSGYPAGCGNFTGSPNSDLITMDGVLWERLADYDIEYSWNLAVYCMDENGKSMALPELTLKEKYTEKDVKPQLGHLKPVYNLRKLNKKSNALLGYHFYRDGEQINTELITDTFYSDTLVDHYPWIGVCWVVTALYEDCESDPSNEVCTDVIPATHRVENSINIYPNPANHYLHIESNEFISNLIIMNNLGQIKSEYKNINNKYFRLHTMHFENGMYLLEIRSKTGIQKAKIIIQN